MNVAADVAAQVILRLYQGNIKALLILRPSIFKMNIAADAAAQVRCSPQHSGSIKALVRLC